MDLYNFLNDLRYFNNLLDYLDDRHYFFDNSINWLISDFDMVSDVWGWDILNSFNDLLNDFLNFNYFRNFDSYFHNFFNDLVNRYGLFDGFFGCNYFLSD